MMPATPLLDRVALPSDVRQLARSDLPALCAELRSFVLHSVASTGGHLASNLGSIELTVALHYVYNTPHDRIVWDVGHQCYAHKVLTGRRAGMAKLRMWEGLAGFPTRRESDYDTFGVAHSSTSISAAFGMAAASRLQGIERHAIAVIGDGAMSAGMAFEALNNAGATDTDLLVILNDNDMSISEPVGALNNYLARLLTSKFYDSVRRGGKKVLSRMPRMHDLVQRAEEHAKGMIVPGTLFEEFGFNYAGPIDGHNIELLVATLENEKRLRGPRLLHIVTKKGAGYAKAEADPINYHGVGKFDPAIGLVPKAPPAIPKPTYSEVFGQWLCDAAAADPKVVAITPAMREGSGMVEYSQRFPTRYFDVGIAEQHAVTFAAGLACEGLKPVVAIYSTFLQRAYDQWVHDVTLQNLPVVLAIDRAGQVGADGATHAGSFDIAYLRCLPNTLVLTPSDENETRQALSAALAANAAVAVRYPRGTGPGVTIDRALTTMPIGKAEVRRASSSMRLAVLCFGPLLHSVLKLAEELDLTVVNMRSVKPLDVELVRDMAATHERLVTAEEGVVQGGAGSAVLEALQSLGLAAPVTCLGFPDRFIEQGDPALQMKDIDLDVDGLRRQIKALL